MRREHAREASRERNAHRGGITRIELLVVIALGALLVGCGREVVEELQADLNQTADQQEALKQAQGIAMALRVYAADEDGFYPAGETSNQSFSQLFPELGEERVFYVRGSAWHGNGRFKDGPDELFEGDDNALEPGENHWAFNVLADTESKASLPLIADGFTARIGRYTSDRDRLGGLWGGKTAIVINCSGFAEIVDLDKQMRYTNPRANNRDEFEREGVEMINPEPPRD